MKWTNIDYIRAMDTDELTSFLYEHLNCKPEGKCPIDNCDGANCKEHIKKWLQEVRK
jgi:hypothetical protein